MLSWDACSFPDAPVVGTFHAYSTKRMPNTIANLLGARRKFNQLTARIAVSEAAAWTGRRWFGGEYHVIPNGVDVDAPPAGPKPRRRSCRVLFVGRSEERKGLPVLLQAFEGLIEHVPARLTLIGASPEDVKRYVPDPATEASIENLGRVSGQDLWRQLHQADVLCAPSLAGESFGMVLTEAFAAGTPVIASEIAGYADVVTDGADGILVPPADPQRLAEELQRLYLEPGRAARPWARAARRSARSATPGPGSPSEVEDVYEQARRAPEPSTAWDALAGKTGVAPIDGGPRRPRQAPALARSAPGAGRGAPRMARRIGAGRGRAARRRPDRARGAQDRPPERRGEHRPLGLSSGSSSPPALMMAAMFCAPPRGSRSRAPRCRRRPLRRRDVTSATMIGVLMSATLPARLGEPARAMVLSRRTGRMRETFPVLLGTLVSQTALNIVALGPAGRDHRLDHRPLPLEHPEALPRSASLRCSLLVAVLAGARRGAPGRIGASRAGGRRDPRRAASSPHRPGRLPRPAPWPCRRRSAALRLGDPAAWPARRCSRRSASSGNVGIGAAAAVLFAVNVTAVVPATPSNIGVFQLAVISVLTTGFGVAAADALAYGVILQAVEIATAVTLGVPALWSARASPGPTCGCAP